MNLPRTPPDTTQRLALALARIEGSRGCLRLALLPRAHDHDEALQRGAASGGLPRVLRRWRAWLWRWVGGTPLAPLVKPATAAVGSWWHHHPWRATGVAVGRAVSHELGPVIRRHPVLSVSLAATAGAAVVLARPWRWEPVAAQAQSAGRRAIDSTLSWSWQQLSQPSVQMAMATALAAWSGQQASKAAADVAASLAAQTQAQAATGAGPVPDAPDRP